jgi:hypothetical protein
VFCVISGLQNALTSIQVTAESSQGEVSVVNMEISKRLSRPSTQDLSGILQEKPEDTARGKKITKQQR